MPAPGRASHGPYGFCEQQDTVDVIGHDDESIQQNLVEMIRNIVPARCYRFTDLAELHLAFQDFSEKAAAVSRAYRYEIGA